MNARVQFDVSKERLRNMEDLADRLGLSTRKDLFNNALTLLEWAVEQKESGRKIASIDEDAKSYRELVMPALESIRSEDRIK